MVARAAILAVLIASGGLYARTAGSREVPAQRTALSRMPCVIDGWQCSGDVPLDRESLDVLRLDDYVNRGYVDADGRSAALFVGYYASQRQGDTIHSPLNCLPGSGWEPIATTSVNLGRGPTTLPATKLVVQKGLDRQVVVYWYQGRGRRIADDYVNKFWLVVDAMRLHRSDGGIVRVVAARADVAERFARVVAPQLSSYLP